MIKIWLMGDPEAMQQMKMCCLASISFLDAQVGRLLQWHKFTLCEPSARIPLMIRVPGVTGPGG